MKKFIIILLFLVVLISVCGCVSCAEITSAFANNEYITIYEINAICKNYTSSDIDFLDYTVHDYPQYMEDRYFAHNLNFDYGENVADEFILKVVPEVLFVQKIENYSYFGNYYGFYFNYIQEEDKYFIFLFICNLEVNNNGHIERNFMPLYYEQYVYENGIVMPYYYEHQYANRHYCKYSDSETLYIKNVKFNGALYNLNDYNYGDDEYQPLGDNGGYFIGGSYVFEGMLSDSSQIQFATETAIMILGYIPVIGKAMDLIEAAASFGQTATAIQNDFKENFSNNDDFTFSMVDITRESQVSTYGSVLKNYSSSLLTENDETSLLLTINKGHFITNKFFYNFADQNNKANTRFTCNLQFDIVKDNNPAFGTNLSTIKSISSNAIETYVYNENIDVAEENETEQVYALQNQEEKFTFTAPVSGRYTIETSGNVANTIEAEKGTLSALQDNINKKLTVDLVKDEVFPFSVFNTSSAHGIFNVKVTFTPDEAVLGTPYSFSLQPGETKYIQYSLDSNEAVNFELSKTGNFTAEIMRDRSDEMIDFVTGSGKKVAGSIIAQYPSRYFIGIRNDSNTAETVNITLTAPENKTLGNTITYDGAGKLYSFTAPTESIRFKVTGNAEYYADVIVYDNEFNAIASQTNVNSIDLTGVSETGKAFYIYLENRHDNAKTVNVTVAEDAPELLIGTNTINTEYAGEVRAFEPDITLNYSFSVPSGSNVKVYESDWDTVYAQSGKYELTAGEKYFVSVSGESADITVNVSFDNTESLSGSLSSGGYQMLKFTPAVRDIYNVTGTGISEYSIYTASLIPTLSYLNAGESYYIYINGTPNAAYDVQIGRRVRDLSVNAIVAVDYGIYKINVTEAGAYIIAADSLVATDKYSVYDSNMSALSLNNSAANSKLPIDFEEGVYYIDIIAAESNFGMHVYGLHMDDSALNTTLTDGTPASYILQNNNYNMFEFTPTSSAEYYFKIYYSNAGTLGFDLTITDTSLNAVSYNNLTLTVFDNDNVSKRYGVSANLTAGTSYFISIKPVNALSENVALTICIEQPSIISDITLNATDGKSLLIMDERSSSTAIKVAMGETYSINAVGAGQFRWAVSAASDSTCYQIMQDGKLTINFNAAYENKTIVLNFIDDSEQILSATLTLRYPYYISASYDKDAALYSVQFSENNTNTESIDAAVSSLNIKLYSGSAIVATLTSENATTSLAAYLDKCFTSISADVTISYISFQYNIDLNSISINNQIITDSQISNLSTMSGQIILDLTSPTISNKTINVGNSVDSLIIISDNTTISNLKFSFGTRDKIYIYLFNIKFISSLRTNPIFYLVNINTTNLYVFGENSIGGSAILYLVQASTICFYGNGTLNITGSDGDNGANGANGYTSTSTRNGTDGASGNYGQHGVGALKCNDIQFYMDRGQNSYSVTLIGGNGGHGGKGGNGGNGADGEAVSYTEVLSPGNGGNGGIGGRGGDGALGCSIEIDIAGIKVENGDAGLGGNGGDGGNGGEGSDTKMFPRQHGVRFPVSATNGGNGGNGGAAGVAGEIGRIKYNTSDFTYGKGGNGGNGGDGGDGILSPDNIYYGNAGYGGRGGDGGQGVFGGNGGNGGDGGNGASGHDGTIFVKAGNGQPGANGGDGGNGGTSISESYFYLSSGGSGGLGGPGGPGGDAILDSNATVAGQDGLPGAPGEDGTCPNFVAPSCITPGTLITLADGTQKAVEELTGNEMLLVWDMFNGTFSAAPILFIDSDPLNAYEVITLTFADGTNVEVIDEHGFWNVDLNEYVFLRADAAKYIGDKFNKQTVDANGNMTYTAVELVSVSIATEYTTAWSPVTYGHLCYYVNGMLSMPGATTGLINIFEVDPDTMKIDEEAYAEDIAEYGVYTYEEFTEEIAEVPETIFNAFGGAYLKVAIGKGILTEDMILELISRYSEFFD